MALTCGLWNGWDWYSFPFLQWLFKDGDYLCTGRMASGTLWMFNYPLVAKFLVLKIALILIRLGFANRLCFQFHGGKKGNEFGDQPVCATVSFENKTTWRFENNQMLVTDRSLHLFLFPRCFLPWKLWITDKWSWLEWYDLGRGTIVSLMEDFSEGPNLVCWTPYWMLTLVHNGNKFFPYYLNSLHIYFWFSHSWANGKISLPSFPEVKYCPIACFGEIRAQVRYIISKQKL